MYHSIIEVLPLVLCKGKVDGFIFKFGGAREDIKVFDLFVVWEPPKDIIFGNLFSCLGIIPTIMLFGNNLVLEEGEQGSCS
jgi:hypothetical protein